VRRQYFALDGVVSTDAKIVHYEIFNKNYYTDNFPNVNDFLHGFS